MADTSILEELQARGLVHSVTAQEELDKLMQNEVVSFYIGFDPTSTSLHAGSLLQIATMARLQRAGHKPFALIGVNSDPKERVLEAIEYVGLGIEAIGVVVIAAGIVWGLVAWVKDRARLDDSSEIFRNCRQRIGRSLVLGLEILVAADIIHTVAIEPTLENIGALGVLILVRTFVNWTLVLDLEDRWPWQKPAQ